MTNPDEAPLVGAELSEQALANELTSGDAPVAQKPPPSPDRPADEPLPALKRMSPFDEQRKAIADSLRAERSKGNLPYHGDFRDPTQTYGSLAAEEPAPLTVEDAERIAGLPEPGVPENIETEAANQQRVEPEPDEPAADEPLFKLNIRGREVYVPQSQVLAEAQKSLASDDYLDETRQVLRTAKQVASQHQHPDADYSARSNAPNPDDPQHPADDLLDAVNELQLGADPEVATQKLRDTMRKEARAVSRETVIEDRVNLESGRARLALAEFITANETLARDPIARDLITQQCSREYRADIAALGVPYEKIPTDPVTVADWHIQLRATGAGVRDMPAILNKAADAVRTFQGAPQPRPGQPAQPRQPQTRTQVVLNRDGRRANIQPQPTRATAPRMATPQPQRRDVSDIVNQARKARGQPVA